MSGSTAARISITMIFGGVLALCPCAAADLPHTSSALASDLGEPTSTMSVAMFRVPYFSLESLMLDVTLRNPTSKPLSLPSHQVLTVDVERVPAGDGIQVNPHQCGAPRFENQFLFGPKKHLEIIRAEPVSLAPGESRTARWISSPLSCQYEGTVMMKEGVVYGVRISAHGLVPDRWIRFAVGPFTDPIRTFTLTNPKDRSVKHFWWAGAEPGSYHLLSTSSFYHFSVAPFLSAPTAAELNQWLFGGRGKEEACGLYCHGVFPTMSIDVRYDPQGSLLIDGKPWRRPWVVYGPAANFWTPIP